eukprot:gene23639-32009_t
MDAIFGNNSSTKSIDPKETPLPSIPFSNRTKISNGILKQAFASSIGSITATVILNPINVVKVRMQQQKYILDSHAAPAAPVHISPRITAVGIFQSIIKESKGVRGLWAGTSAGMIMSVPNTVIYMTSYERFKVILGSIFRSADTAHHVIPAFAGALARLVSVSVTSPLELIRTIQTAARPAASSSFLRIGHDIVSKEGVVGFYRGWLPTVLRDCPYSAIYWVSFELLKSSIYSKANRNLDDGTDMTCLGCPIMTTNSTATFLSGSISGFIAAVCTHPFDVMKTQQQLSNAAGGSSSSFLGMLQKGGIRSLYTGLTMRLSTVIPGGAIMVTVYEYFKSIDL